MVIASPEETEGSASIHAALWNAPCSQYHVGTNGRGRNGGTVIGIAVK